MSGDDNEQILNDIQKLQKIEQDLFSSLDNPQIQPDTSTKIISKINDVSQMRINLYKLLNNLNSNYQNSLTNSREVLSEQNVAIDIVETELNRAKKRLAVIEEEKNNKIRLIEINTYYGQSYDEHANMMKLFIYILIPIIGLAFLFKQGFIPSSIYTVLNVVIILIGVILLWRNYSKIYMHDKLNYPEYAWTFDASTAPGPDMSLSASNNDPWGNINTTCIGSACCMSGTNYDYSLNKCVPNTSTNTSTSTSETFINMDKMNQVFTKHTSEFKKPDITMNSKIYPKNY
jgi:hypothetical protein